MNRPEHVIVARRSNHLPDVVEVCADVGRDQAGYLDGGFEEEPGFGELAVDGVLGTRQECLARPEELVERAFGSCGVGSHDEDGCAVAEEGGPDEAVEVGLVRGAVRDGRDLCGDGQDARQFVIFREIFRDAERRGAPEAAGLVHHDAADRWGETEQLGNGEIRPRHVHPTRGAEHDVRDFGLLPSPFRDGFRGGLGCQLRHLLDHDVLPCGERWLVVGGYHRIRLDHLLRQIQVSLPDSRLVTYITQQCQTSITIITSYCLQSSLPV